MKGLIYFYWRKQSSFILRLVYGLEMIIIIRFQQLSKAKHLYLKVPYSYELTDFPFGVPMWSICFRVLGIMPVVCFLWSSGTPGGGQWPVWRADRPGEDRQEDHAPCTDAPQVWALFCSAVGGHRVTGADLLDWPAACTHAYVGLSTWICSPSPLLDDWKLYSFIELWWHPPYHVTGGQIHQVVRIAVSKV